RVDVGRRPPGKYRAIGQTLHAVTHDVAERGIDLDDCAVLVADEESLLQRVDKGRPPAGVMVAKPRQLDVGAHAGEQFGSRERFDEIVVSTGLQALDGG